MSRSALHSSLAALVLVSAGCDLHAGRGQQDLDHGGPALTFSRVSLSEFDGSRKVWDLKADAIRYDERTARLQGVTLRYFKDGHVAAVCQAPEANLDTLTRDLDLAGPVKIDTEKGEALVEAQHVQWSAAERKLRAQGRIVVRHGLSRLVAHGIEADEALTKVNLVGPIDGRFKLEGGH